VAGEMLPEEAQPSHHGRRSFSWSSASWTRSSVLS
jgi:hypothetical protein